MYQLPPHLEPSRNGNPLTFFLQPPRLQNVSRSARPSEIYCPHFSEHHPLHESSSLGHLITTVIINRRYNEGFTHGCVRSLSLTIVLTVVTVVLTSYPHFWRHFIPAVCVAVSVWCMFKKGKNINRTVGTWLADMSVSLFSRWKRKSRCMLSINIWHDK